MISSWKVTVAILLCALATVLFSCNDDSLVGSGLVDEGGIDVRYSDTVTIAGTLQAGVDSIQMNGPNVKSSFNFVGSIDDPLFGKRDYEAYFKLGLGTVVPRFYDKKNKAFAQVDSVVLYLNIDTALYYGDRTAAHDIKLNLLSEDFENDRLLYTKDQLSVEPMTIGGESPSQAIFESIKVKFEGDSAVTTPSIRIKLDNSFGEMLVQDTSSMKSDSLFKDLIKGIRITSTSDKPAILALKLGVTSAKDIGNKLNVYYKDTTAKAHSFPLIGVNHTHFVRDNENSLFQEALNDNTISDSLIMVDGFGGSEFKFEFPYANFENLGNILVKKAELEFTVADLADDLEELNPMPFMLLYQKDSEGARLFTEDFIAAKATGSVDKGFGGFVEHEDQNDGSKRSFYKFNVTRFMQLLIDEGSMADKVLYLGAGTTKITPHRSILYGLNHSKYPVKLKLVYSLPN